MRKFAKGYGIKWLSPYGSTTYQGKEFFYNLPAVGEKWSQPTVHPDPAEPDGNDCGPGRLHVMNVLSNPYCLGGWPWWARYELTDIVGASDEKTGVIALRLRRIPKRTFWRMLRLGWGQGGTNLAGANLYRANLTRANLYEANLYEANLYRADLSGANLSGANLTGANLTEADLYEANLSEARWDEYTVWPDGFDAEEIK